jgi:hypothetical protein
MKSFLKTLVFLLLVAVTAAPLAAQGFRPGGASHEQRAGCHEHDGNLPAPAPASHNCCQAGHHPAIVQQSSGSRTSLQAAAQIESSQNAAVVAVFNFFPSLVLVSGGPPLPSPLRV